MGYMGNVFVWTGKAVRPSSSPNSALGATDMAEGRLGVGFVGAGFNARFHFQGLPGRAGRGRDGDLGSGSKPSGGRCRAGPPARGRTAKPYTSITEMVDDPAIDAIWLTAPNFAAPRERRRDHERRATGRATLAGIACEKPLGRNVAEATKVVELVKRTGLKHGYLENQVFSPQNRAGPVLALGARRGPHRATLSRPGRGRARRPALALVLARQPARRRRPERHDVPLRAGGAPPADRREACTVKPMRIAGQIATLKWSRPEYAKRLSKAIGPEVDYAGAQRRLRVRDDRVRNGGRPAGAWRSHDLVELRRRRTSAQYRAARPRVLDVLEQPRRRAEAVLQSRGEG